MIWLVRFWPYLASLAFLFLGGLGLYRAGYNTGHRAADAHWQPLFLAAEKAAAEAEARTDAKEKAAVAITLQTEAHYVQALKDLEARSDAADQRIHELVRRVASAARCREVPKVPGAPSGPDEPTPFVLRLDELGGRLTGIARDCEADAEQLAALQGWITSQGHLQEQP